jgi:hypothetical protein
VNPEMNKKWCHVFQVLKSKNIQYRNTKVVVSSALAVAGRKAAVERFFIVNSLRYDNKNHFTTETVKALSAPFLQPFP